MRWRVHTVATLLSVVLLGCGEDGLGFSSSDKAGGGGFGNTGAPNIGNDDGGLSGDRSDGELPPEVELQINFEQPQASERFVYTANPQGGSVSIIDADKLTIQTLEPGDQPTFLTTLEGTDDAIVLNVGSDDATVIRNPAEGATTVNLPVVRGSNAIGVAPDGKHAVVYFNSQLNPAGNDSGSFQDVTVIKLDPDNGDSSVDMTVGFRPRSVFFSANSAEAFVVSEDGVSVLDFANIDQTGSGIARLVSFGAKLNSESLDISVTPDGRFALAREADSSVLRLVNLLDGKIRSIDLSKDVELPIVEVAGMDAGVDDEDAGVDSEAIGKDAITDLDLSPSGAYAMAVVRSRGAVLRIPVPEGFDDPDDIEVTAIEGEIIGSVSISPDEKFALLYTTATNDERMTILDLETDKARSIELRKAVTAVAIADDGTTALIIHKKLDGDPTQAGLDPDTSIDLSFGYSVLRLATADVKLQVTDSAPGAFAIVPDGSFLFVLFNAGEVREAQQVELKSFLVDTIPLGSPPISVGAVRAVNRVFVGQDHEDGRITFIDWKNGEIQTVTGFELNSRIRD